MYDLLYFPFQNVIRITGEKIVYRGAFVTMENATILMVPVIVVLVGLGPIVISVCSTVYGIV